MANAEVGSAYVTIYPQTDGNFSKQVGQSMGDNIGSGLSAKAVAIGNIISNVAMNAASAIGEQFSNAFDSYATFEQLEGGAKLMFGDAYDYIEKRSQEAYKNVQMSQNEYLEQVNGFAVGLKTALGGNEQAAAELSDKIITAEADIVAATGNTQENVQNAFNGIMKGNYTMLDNLQIGIKPTKEGMQEVIDKVNEWNAAQGKASNYTIDNLADCEAAVVDYIDMVGMSGYAQQEAAGTIQGSLSMLKSSWDNLLSGLLNKDADLGALGQNVLDSLGAVVSNVTPLLGTLAMHVVEELPNIFAMIFDSAKALVSDGIRSAFGEDAATAFNEAIGGLSTVVQDAFGAITSVIESLTPVAMSLWDTISAVFPDIQEIISVAFNEVSNIVQTVWPHVQGVIEAAARAIQAIIEVVWPLVKNIVETAMEGMSAVIQTVWPVILGAVENAMNGIEAAIRAIEPIVDFISGIFDGVRAAIEDPIGTAQGFIEDAMSTIEGIIHGLDLSLPDIALPHFWVDGGAFPWGIGGQGSPPNFGVDWYAKGGFVDGATLIGAGERGPEMILPRTGRLMDEFASAVSDRIDGGDEVPELLRQLLSKTGTVILDGKPVGKVLAPIIDAEFGTTARRLAHA